MRFTDFRTEPPNPIFGTELCQVNAVRLKLSICSVKVTGSIFWGGMQTFIERISVARKYQFIIFENNKTYIEINKTLFGSTVVDLLPDSQFRVRE